MFFQVLSFLAFSVQLLSVLPGVSAQAITNATCRQGDWTFNSKQQSPCQVAAYLGATCNNGLWNIIALGSGQYYLGPNQQQTNPCECSTVTYSMTSACAYCQGNTWETWDTWNQNCGTVYPSVYTENIPLNTSVPGWAYLDVVSGGGTWNATTSEADTSAPESTGTPPATGTATSPSTGSPTSGTSKKKKSNAGAIAGGVVGGLVGLGLIIGAVAFFLVRRRRSKTAPSAAYGSYNTGQGGGPLHSPPPMGQPDFGHQYDPSVQKIYDPADPSTFPSTPPPGTIHTTDTGSFAHQHPGQITQPGQYSFVPEV